MKAEKPIGNAAALREALVNIRGMVMDGGFDGRSPAYIVNICDTALSAPPRNCDRFETREDAQDAFEAQYSNRGKEALKRYPNIALDVFCDWLFDEAKGENDGSK